MRQCFVGFHGGWTFVILDPPRFPILCGAFPLFEFWKREERQLVGLFENFDDGRDELLKEIHLQERGPVVMDEVDQESLDVRPVLILRTETVN